MIHIILDNVCALLGCSILEQLVGCCRIKRDLSVMVDASAIAGRAGWEVIGVWVAGQFAISIASWAFLWLFFDHII